MDQQETPGHSERDRDWQSVHLALEQCLDNERRCRGVFDAMNEGYALIEPLPDRQGQPCDFRLLAQNPAFNRLTGFSDAATGKTVRELAPEIEPELIDTLAKVALTGKPVRLEYHFARIDRWFELFSYRAEMGVIANLLFDITDRKRMELKLREHETVCRSEAAALQATYDTAPLGLCVLDTALRFVRVNERLAEINGVPVGDHLGRTVREVIPALAEKVETGLRRVLATGEPIVGQETTSETPAQPGVLRTWTSNFWPLRDASGNIIGINVTAEEITERKRAEESRIREQEFRSLAENSTDSISRFDQQLRYVYANPAIARQLGYPREAIMGKTHRDLGLSDSVVDAYDRRLFEAFASGKEQHAELRIDNPQGEVILDCRLIPERGTDGAVETILSISRDVTDQRRAEAALTESERKYRELVENLYEGIWLIDGEGVTTFVNSRLGEMFGYPPRRDAGPIIVQLHG